MYQQGNIYLPQGHDAHKILGVQGFQSGTYEDAPANTTCVLLFNTMSNPRETEIELAQAFGPTPHEIMLDIVYPDSIFERAKIDQNSPDEKIREKALHRLSTGKAASQINLDDYHGGIFPGFAKPDVEFEHVAFFHQISSIQDTLRKKNTPILNICWSSHFGLNRYSGIERLKRDEKLSGLFNIRVEKPDHPLMKNMGSEFKLPVSRSYYSVEEQILTNPNLIVLASSPETGSALIAEKNRNVFYATGHLEYNEHALPNEDKRDQERVRKGELNRAPVIHNVDLKNPKMEWLKERHQFFAHNLAGIFNEYREERQPQAANMNRPLVETSLHAALAQ